MPKNGHHIIQEEKTEETDVKRMFRMLYDLVQKTKLEEDKRYAKIEEQLSILMAKLSSGEEWIELREWCRLTGEHYETAKKKCGLGEYKIKPRSKRGAKYYIHRSELKRHKLQEL